MRPSILVLFFLFTLNTSAQTTQPDARVTTAPVEQKKEDYKKWLLTLKPLGIIDPFHPNLTLGVQYFITEKTAVEVCGGVIQSLYKFNLFDQKNIKVSGYRFTFAIKHKLSKKFFVGLQGFYNDFTKKDDEFVWRFAKAYEQEMKVKRDFNVAGGHLMCGVMLIPDHRKMYLELFGGVGLRYRKIALPSFPSDAQIQVGPGINYDRGINENPFTYDIHTNESAGDVLMPSIILGANIGIKL